MSCNRRLSSALAVCAAILVAPAGLAQTSPAAPGTTTDVVCTLNQAGPEYAGVCAVPCRVNALAVNFDRLLENCRSDTPPRSVKASLKKVDAAGNWLGNMEGKYPEDPTRFELSRSPQGRATVAQLPFGWFPLKTATQSADALVLVIDAAVPLPPTRDDLRIIDRALALLNDVAIWNKNDTRICPPDPVKWSLFCALTQATVEVSGGVHYRQPALEAVREVLNEVGGTRLRAHRLMDYNNHPDTTLDEVHALLRTAKARVERKVSPPQ